MGELSMADLRTFLSTSERPVGAKEMAEFWRSLSDEEKVEFKSTSLS